MNMATKYILHNLLKKYGLSLARNASLCDAYLSDLMFSYPEERRLLVQAVAEGIPAQLLLNRTDNHRHKMIAQFVGSHAVSQQEATQVIDVWVFALQSVREPLLLKNERRTLRHYLTGGLVALVVLGVSSAIAVYQMPQRALDYVAVTSDEEETVSNDPLQHGLEKAVEKPQVEATVDNQNNALSGAAKKSVLTEVVIGLKPHSDQPELSMARADIADPVAQNNNPLKHEVSNQRAREAMQAFAETEGLLLRDEWVVKAEPPLKKPQKLIKRPEPQTRKQVKPSPAKLAKPKPATKQTKPVAKPVANAAAKKVQAQAHRIAKQLISTSVNFGQTTVSLQKQYIDRNVLKNLLKLTQEPYYQQQLQQLTQRIDALRKKQDVLSRHYVQHLQQLCNFRPGIIQAGVQQLAVVDAYKQKVGGVAYQALRQHATRCPDVKSIKSQNVVYELSLAYKRAFTPQ